MKGSSVVILLLLVAIVAYFAIKMNKCTENYGFGVTSGLAYNNVYQKRLGGPCGKSWYSTTPGFVLM